MNNFTLGDNNAFTSLVTITSMTTIFQAIKPITQLKISLIKSDFNETFNFNSLSFALPQQTTNYPPTSDFLKHMFSQHHNSN